MHISIRHCLVFAAELKSLSLYFAFAEIFACALCSRWSCCCCSYHNFSIQVCSCLLCRKHLPAILVQQVFYVCWSTLNCGCSRAISGTKDALHSTHAKYLYWSPNIFVSQLGVTMLAFKILFKALTDSLQHKYMWYILCSQDIYA